MIRHFSHVFQISHMFQGHKREAGVTMQYALPPYYKAKGQVAQIMYPVSIGKFFYR